MANEQRRLSPLRAPRENHGIVVDPPWSEVAKALAENRRTRAAFEYDFQGISFHRLMAQSRRELCEAAVEWKKTYGSAAATPDDDGPIILAGHQPQMFHPGVWLKNFALGKLAEAHRATAVNLIIDSDVAAKPAIQVPSGSLDAPTRESVAYDQPNPAVPYEERKIEDRSLFESFPSRVSQSLSPFIKNPLLARFWPKVIEQSHDRNPLGASLARARHLLEGEWGISTWEVPQSTVCDRPAFFRFIAHLLAHLPRFAETYNEAVREYRSQHRIRNHAHPVPDLTMRDDWCEAPFWIWTKDDPHRRHLFVRSTGKEIVISDRGHFEARLSLGLESDGARAAEQLAELRRRGVKIRSRALITTLWARLLLGDYFIHGIGGGNYDHVTDTIIERFFGVEPPDMMVLSATLHLPIERPKRSAEKVRDFETQLRQLKHQPERFLSEGDSRDAFPLVAEKKKWIGTAQTRENAKQRCTSIRRVNEILQPRLAVQREELERRLIQATEEERIAKILDWREYAFCLFPESTISDFFADALKAIS
jgi:hypothetical protein